MHQTINNTAGVILSGGRSSRMGSDKSQLQWLGKSLLDHSKTVLDQSDVSHVYFSGSLGIVDCFEEKGPLSGIYSSLEYLKNYDYLIFTAVDMPLLNKDVYQALIEHSHLSTIVYFEKWYLPFIAHNQANVRDKILAHINKDKLSLKHTFKELNAQSISNSYGSDIFANVNTAEDWHKIKNNF